VATAEARRLMRLANVDALKQQLGEGEVIPYADLLRVCQEAGAACLPVLLAAGYPCLFVRCLNSRMTHQPIPCGGGLPVRSGESTGRDAAGLRSRISELSLPPPAARGTVALQSRRVDGGRKKLHHAWLVLTPSHVVVAA